MRARADACAWVHGEPAGCATRFCGNPTVDGTWCEHHRGVVYGRPEAEDDADAPDDDLDALAGAAE